MRAAALVDLVARDLKRSLRTFSVAAVGITVGVATLAFFLALSAGMREVVLGRIFPLDRFDYFLGAQLRFNDEDLKSILPFAGGLAGGAGGGR